MAQTTTHIGTVCRFCLRQEGLIDLSTAMRSAFTFEDVVYYSGIQISETEETAICHECCIAINNSVNFRRTCLSNDIVFKKLSAILKTCVVNVDKQGVPTVDSSIVIIDSDIEEGSKDTHLEDDTKNEVGVITVDVTDSDDSRFHGDDALDDSNDTIATISNSPAVETVCNDSEINHASSTNVKMELNTTSGEQQQASRSDNVESNVHCDETMKVTSNVEVAVDPIYLHYDETMKVAPNEEVAVHAHFQGNAQPLCNNPEQQTKRVVSQKKKKKKSKYRSQTNSRIDDGSDSDDSIISLYSEVMRAARNQRSKKALPTAESSGVTEPSADGVSMEKETVSAKTNSKTLDNADSDSSVASLYDEKECKKITSKIIKLEELCPYCGIFTRDWLNHIKRRHIKNKKFACPHCPKKYMDRLHLKVHINTWHEKRIILTCDQCGKGFINPGSHFYHMKNSHGKSSEYECEICHRKFKSIDGFKKHQKEHSMTALKCKDCGKLYATIAMLEKHQLRYHPS